ncbi:MAG TPA: hypothetical protein VF329_05580 [Gammaproteobacteria bacterium]
MLTNRGDFMTCRFYAAAVLASLTLGVSLAVAQPGPPNGAAAQPRRAEPGQPAGPAPRRADGRVLLGGASPEQKGIWAPVGIGEPLTNVEQVPFKKWARALYDARLTTRMEPHSRCKPSGAARQFQTPYGVEFVEFSQLERMYIFDIGGPHTFRTVYMDGRAHPRDLAPTHYGHSIGWWEGDTLVIDTVGYNEGFWLDRRGLPHTEALHTIERFTRLDAGTMKYEMIVDDPGAYTAPWTGTFNLRWEEGTELFEYICQQANEAGELLVGFEGRTSVDRTSPIVP